MRKRAFRTLAARESLSEFPCVKGFFYLRESGSFGNRITDEVTGSVFYDFTFCNEGSPPTMNVEIQGSGTLLSGPGIENPSNRDFALIVCAEAKSGPSGIGAVGMYAVGGTKRFRVQPYYGLFGTGVRPSERIAPLQNQGLKLPLVDGQPYISAFMKAGNLLHHYGDNGEVNTTDINLLLQDSGDPATNTRMQALYDSIVAENDTPIDTFSSFGHSGIGDLQNEEAGVSVAGEILPVPHSAERVGNPSTYEVPSSFPSGTTDEPQLYIGALLCVFDSGLPSDFAKAIGWMKSQWVKKKMLIWPGWRNVK